MYQSVSIYRESVEREEGTSEGCIPPKHLVRILSFLVDVFIHIQDRRTGQIYVEVVLSRKKEGKFLEDPKAHRDETMGQVSKLGGFR